MDFDGYEIQGFAERDGGKGDRYGRISAIALGGSVAGVGVIPSGGEGLHVDRVTWGCTVRGREREGIER
ncbi:hypothetical protein ACFX12_004689 [Malus domestica]